jgi:hypothetical protein
MSLPLDHIVIAVHDLHSAIHDYRNLGFTVTPGGDHPGRATHNALVVFQDGSYFELIAWKAPEATHPWWPKLSRFGPGIVDFALLPGTTPQVVAQALSRGLAYQPPVDGGRLRPDGVKLRWQNARPATPDLPFLCGDVTPRALLGLEDVPAPAEGAASLQLGRTVLKLETASANAEAAQRLALQGEGPFAIGLHTTQSHPLGPVVHGHTHGALLELIALPDALAGATPRAHAQSAFA